MDFKYSKETWVALCVMKVCRLRLKCDGTRAETRFRLLAKRMNPFKSAGASVQSTTGSRGVRISGSNAGYTTFRGSVKGTGCPLNSSVSLILRLPCDTMYHHISTGLYLLDTVLQSWRFVCLTYCLENGNNYIRKNRKEDKIPTHDICEPG